MSITVLNYMDQALVSRINEQAAKRAEAAKQSNTDDFAAALADSTKALENSNSNKSRREKEQSKKSLIGEDICRRL